jgi:hypothetical protein
VAVEDSLRLNHSGRPKGAKLREVAKPFAYIACQYRRRLSPLKNLPSHSIIQREICERREIGLWRAEARISIARICAPMHRLSVDGYSRK